MNKKQNEIAPSRGVMKVADSKNIASTDVEAVDAIEEILKNVPPLIQNNIVNQLVQNNAIRRYGEYDTNNNLQKSSAMALEDFVTKNPAMKDMLESYRKSRERGN